MRMTVLVAAALVILMFTRSDAATAHFMIVEDSGNLEVSALGTFDLDGLEDFGLSFGNQGALISVSPTALGFVPSDSNLFGVVTTAPIGPGPFGTGNAEIEIPIMGGDVIAFAMDLLGDNNLLASYFVVPQGYQSGTPLSNSLILPDATLAEFGLIAGTYLYPIGNNDITVQISQVVVPLPTSGVLLVFAVLSVLVRRQFKTAV